MLIFEAYYREIILRIKAFIFSSLLLLSCPLVYGQTMIDLTFRFFDSGKKSNKLFPDEFLKIDSVQLDVVINRRLNNLYEFGYLAAYHQVGKSSGEEVSIDFITGEVFKMANLSQGNVADEILNKVGFNPLGFNNRPYAHQNVVKMMNSILDYAENHGYPFASIRLDSIEIQNNELSAWINYQSGPLIVFDDLKISGYNKVKTKYLLAHLGIYKGKPYEEQLIKEIPNKINLLTFVDMAEPPEIIISEGKCEVLLNLKQNKVSHLDGILGVLPNQKEGKSLLITGQLNLDLKNLFSSGKRLALEWQSYDAQSQLLDVLYFHPNLFRMPINIQGEFNLLKQDTTFINRELGIELSLLSKHSNLIGFRTEFISSRLISTSGLEGITELPENTDYNMNYYGLNYQVNRLNNISFPTQGFAVKANVSVGQKKIIKNPAFDDGLYNGVNLNSLQFKLYGELDKYWGIYKNIILRTRIHGGYINGDHLFQSDLFRIGGLRTLRGFTENQFYTSGFGIANIEFRATFSEETYFMVFYDQSVIGEEVDKKSTIQYPFGAGAGFSFNTTAGIFNFIFAMGKSVNQPFGINHSKIHFGYISRF